jgi:hypothetical protein
MIDRRTFLITMLLLAVAAGAALQSVNASTDVRLKPLPLAPWAGELEFSLDPPVPEWRLEERDDADRVVYTGGGYRLELDFHRPDPQLLTLQFRLHREDGRPFTVRSYSVKTQVSFAGIYRVWNYRNGPTELMNGFDFYMRGLSSGKQYAQVCGITLLRPISDQK